MIILSIETSCDETAVSILGASGTAENPSFKVLGNALYSQVKIHEKYGGVFPKIAKREHARNLPHLLEKTLKESGFWVKKKQHIPEKTKEIAERLLERETDLAKNLFPIIDEIKKPKIDMIAVTMGPGLEPALWVGINFAKALGALWGVSVVPVNHMEGHIVSPLLNTKTKFLFPSLSLLISGGHTELVYSKTPLTYKLIGRTRDDALGEAYDKVARMLSLPYPGGPQISKLATKKREAGYKKVHWNLPRPMIYTKDFDFSFSGLKTAVLYAIKGKKLTSAQKEEIAKEFEDAVTEVIVSKTKKAILKFKPRSLIIGGGVIANTYIRKQFENLVKVFPKVILCVPPRDLATDNSIMIGMAGYIRAKNYPKILRKKPVFVAEGNLEL